MFVSDHFVFVVLNVKKLVSDQIGIVSAKVVEEHGGYGNRPTAGDYITDEPRQWTNP